MQDRIAEQITEAIAEQEWLDAASEPVQHSIQQVLGNAPRLVADALHGTWLGHPLHAVLTDVPVGSWTATALLDILSTLTHDRRWQKAADASLALGLAGATASAVTGLADWSHLYGKPRRVGLVHAMLNTTATVFYVSSLARRSTRQRKGAIRLAMLGYAVVAAGAFLGGDLVYRFGVGVSRNAWTEGPAKFKVTVPEAELEEGKPRAVMVDGADVMLLRREGRIIAIENTCSHEGGPLAEGKIDGDTVECPWHGSVFRMSDGAVIHGPATMSQPRYEVRVRSGTVEVRRAGK